MEFMRMRPSRFEKRFRCYSVMMMEGRVREDAQFGGKVFLPPSALQELATLNIQYPMMFSLKNEANGLTTHCGVLEFIAEQGRIYIPRWMMQQLLIGEGEIINITNVSLATATYAKFQPQSIDFLDISNPKAVLENTMRKFSCLTEGDIFAIEYNNKVYEIGVLEIKPKDHHGAVSIVECDVQLDFAAPIGYKEPERAPVAPQVIEDEPEEEQAPVAATFFGKGFRLDGRKIKNTSSNVVIGPDAPAPEIQSAAVAGKLALEKATEQVAANSQILDFVPGKLVFKPYRQKRRNTTARADDQPFQGQGQKLR